MNLTDIVTQRPDGTNVTVQDVLSNLYLSKWYGGPSNPGGQSEVAIMGDTQAVVHQLATDLSSDQTAVLQAIQGVAAGAVDVNALADALVPLLSNADGAALITALKNQLNK